MNIGIDARGLDGNRSGIPIYIEEIVKQLSDIDKNNKYIHYAVVNGQTGKVAADLPISFGKYLLFSAILTIPIFICLTILPVVTPITINVFSIVMAVIGFIICLTQMNAFHDKESHLSDLGYQNVHLEKKKRGTSSFQYLWKYIIAVFVALFPIILKPVDDAPYYIASIISFLLILWSFGDLVKIHNMLVSNFFSFS